MKTRLLLSFAAAIWFHVLVPVAPAQTLVAAATEPAPGFTQEMLLTELSRQITERFQVRGELKLDVTRPFGTLSAAGPVEVVILSCPSKLSSSLLLQVRLQKEGRTLADFPVNLKVQQFRDVWAARTPIERGSNFEPSQLDTQRVDVLQQRETVPVDGTAGDLTFATSVQANRLLTWRDLTRRSLVRKGQIVEVTAVDGMLSITTKALAMENGAAGDMVKLRNLESKKDFTALVVAEARTQVRF